MTTVDVALTINPDWVTWQRRYEYHLDMVPPLLEHLRTIRTPLRASRTDNIIVTGTHTDGPPAPANLTAIDTADEIWTHLTEYVREIADTLHENPPTIIGHAWKVGTYTAGLTATRTPAQARLDGFTILTWLIERAPRIEPLALHDTEHELFRTIRRAAHRHLQDAPIRQHNRTCTLCGENTVRVDWCVTGGHLEPAVTCHHCGATYQPPHD